MKLPLAPPDVDTVLKGMDLDTVAHSYLTSGHPLVDGKYLHWDELQHRSPPANLTAEQWWFGISIARTVLLQPLPLLDKSSHPFLFGMPEPVLIDVHHIDRDAAGQIRAAAEIDTPGNRDRYLLLSLIEEAITSSQLEGASTTRKVAAAMLREGRQPRDRHERMIFNNFQTMKTVRELRNQPLTPEIVLDLHRQVTDNTLDDPADAGRLRLTDHVRVVDHRDNTVLHQPPSFQELPERLKRLCAFANGQENERPFVHPVVRAILLHFMIGYDHPFVDGNGRLARTLFYWSMARSGYWLTEFISISHVLRKAPAQYVRAYLYTETDRSDTTYFLIHQLKTICAAIKTLQSYLARKVQEQRDTERLLANSSSLRMQLNHRQVALLTHALKHPGDPYRVAVHQRSHGIAYQTARTDMLNLAELGLLTQGRAGKAFTFTAPPDLKQRLTQLSGQGRIDS